MGGGAGAAGADSAAGAAPSAGTSPGLYPSMTTHERSTVPAINGPVRVIPSGQAANNLIWRKSCGIGGGFIYAFDSGFFLAPGQLYGACNVIPYPIAGNFESSLNSRS